MLKPEYSNYFNVSVNADTHEVVAHFLVEVVIADDNSFPEKKPLKTEWHSVASIAMTLENAAALRDVLTKVIDSASKIDGE
ncbi:MAG: hypothetical protein LBL73_02395 [Synergistaceae bacterium]|jgi:hypothetical protein|nr:hypothetical protein [Synergistaceae bacterium]